MSQANLAAAFDANMGRKLSAGLFFYAGVFYNVRKGAVRFVKAKGQTTLLNRWSMAIAMADQKERAALAAIPRTPARQVIRPMGKGGVRDFIAYARREGIIKTA